MLYITNFLLPLLGVLTALFIGAATYLTYQQMKGFKKNPFSQVPDQLIGRQKEILRLAMQIMTGQSSAIIGAFSNERTAILDALRNPKLYEDNAERFIFAFLDISTLEKECTQAQFWEYALERIPDKITKETDSNVFKAYQFCQENNFNKRSLEKLFEQMKQNDWRLVLLMNRFEEILNQELLNDEAFLGRLRYLASSQHPSPLSLVIALNESFKQFYQGVKDLPKGSPDFNFLESYAITLGALSENEIGEFLTNSDPRFTQADRNFLKDSTGGHPYLLQRATAILMEAYNNQESKPLLSAKAIFFEEAENMLTNILQLLSPQLCKVFVLVAQKQEVSDDFKGELNELNKLGFIKQEHEQWQIRAGVFADLMTHKTVQELCQQKLIDDIH
jgi:predicted CopG family antitoxin